ncbi:hypothetical protein R3P38DRAFT_3134144 [Favolaschia claudopus]|uniref:F-box domain-containing protein n=1 Tax=Favolaschia claudopus TaxID=2862362 RepID=A0AAV9Z7W7_9AGAR
MKESPLNIPELLDLCMRSLAGSTPDLLNCALVARSWVVPAQKQIFYSPRATNGRIYTTESVSVGLNEALCSNPRLVTYVGAIDLCVGDLLGFTKLATFAKLCAHDFTQLRSLVLYILCEVPTDDLQRILSSPSLRFLKLVVVYPKPPADMYFPPPSHFLVHCSPALRHVDLMYTPTGPPPDNLLDAFIPVKSARLDHSVLPSWLYPFDLSELKALALEKITSIPWDLFPIQNLQILEIGASNELAPVELSSLPSLELLRFNLPACIPQMISTSLATMPRSSKIHTILLSYTPNRDAPPNELDMADFEVIDDILAGLELSLHPIVEFEYHVESHDTFNLRRAKRWEAKLKDAFQIAVSRNRFRFVMRNGTQDEVFHWWRDLVFKL